jgi:hypothetical protein
MFSFCIRCLKKERKKERKKVKQECFTVVCVSLSTIFFSTDKSNKYVTVLKYSEKCQISLEISPEFLPGSWQY